MADPKARELIAQEYVRDLVGEHEMGMRIIGETHAKRVIATLESHGFEIVKKSDAKPTGN